MTFELVLFGSRQPKLSAIDLQKKIICLHVGVALIGGARLRGEVLDSWGSGRPRAAGNLIKKV